MLCMVAFPVGAADKDKKSDGKKKEKAEQKAPTKIQLTADGDNYLQDGLAYAEKNVELLYGTTSIYCDRMQFDTNTGWVLAEGNVRIYTAAKAATPAGSQQFTTDTTMYAGPKIHYNVKTSEMDMENIGMANYPAFFRSGTVKSSGEAGKLKYTAGNNVFTTENLQDPGFKIKARVIEYDSEDHRYVMRDVTFVAGTVPFFWIPTMVYNPGGPDTPIQFTPGYSSEWGAFLLMAYGFELNKKVHMKVHLDLRSARGVAGGADLRWIYGKRKVPGSPEGEYGQGVAKAYVAQDTDTSKGSSEGEEDTTRYRFEVKQRAFLNSQKDIYANLDFNKLSDRSFERDFFEDDYRKEKQPDNFFELVKYNENFTLSLLARQQINDFFETVEREPELTLDMKRQRVFPTAALEYQGQTSFVNLERRFDDDRWTEEPKYARLSKSELARWDQNGTRLEFDDFSRGELFRNDPSRYGRDYAASRFDTFHELSLPKQYFGWLNVTPRAGWRGTYYSDSWGDEDYMSGTYPRTDGLGSGGEIFRSVFNTGVEFSFKMHRVYDKHDEKWGIDGIRHVIEPFVNLSYIPNPTESPTSIMQFDGRLRNSTRLQPLTFPQYNSIDSIDNQAIARVGFRQKWQTKRDGSNWDLLEWATYMDVDAETQYYGNNSTSNLYNEVEFNPVRWMSLRSYASTDLHGGGFSEYNNSIDWQVAKHLNIEVGNRYINSADGIYENSNQFYLGSLWRINHNWSFGTRHVYEAEDSALESQRYTLYRDFTSWRMAMSGEIRDNKSKSDEYIVFVSFTLKAAPQVAVPIGFRPGDSSPIGFGD